MFEDFTVKDQLIPTDPRFACGPSKVPVEYLERLAATGKYLMGTSHRKSAVKNLVKEVQEGLLEYFGVGGTHKVVLGNGGATLLFDMIGLGVVQKKSIHYTCGEFSSKWFKSIDSIPWLEAENRSAGYGQGNQFGDNSGADTVCVTLNETSTGVQMSELPKVEEGALLCMDATSGAGQCPCDVSKVDVFFFSPQKVFASDGGLWVAIMSDKAIERALSIAGDKSRYVPGIMDWNAAITNGEKNQTYNTPAIATLFFMNEQIKEMNKLGYSEVQKLAEEKANFLYSWASEKEYLSCYVEKDSVRSRAVACIDVDEKIPISDLINVLRKKKILQGIDAYRKLGRNQMRIALFHNVTFEDLKKLTTIVSLAIESEL
ncbi:MAG: phosphoserine transaminase [Bacteriovoracaceae bacterium]|jgi:phosphoserine aminotransferase|nr:phosphoserine transaminase [Bacteriovoracaceae bacterium]